MRILSSLRIRLPLTMTASDPDRWTACEEEDKPETGERDPAVALAGARVVAEPPFAPPIRQ